MHRCVHPCANVGQKTLAYCLQHGGRHTDAVQYEAVIDCAEFCRTTLDFLVRGSEMARCAEAYRRTADACREMVSGF